MAKMYEILKTKNCVKCGQPSDGKPYCNICWCKKKIADAKHADEIIGSSANDFECFGYTSKNAVRRS